MDKYLKIALLDEKRVDLGTVKVRGLAFADDELVMAIEGLQRMLIRLNTGIMNMGLKIKLDKTKNWFIKERVR